MIEFVGKNEDGSETWMVEGKRVTVSARDVRDLERAVRKYHETLAALAAK